MHIAILGTRGVPANYGGFETFAEELGKRLVDRGHEVTIYGRRRFFEVVESEPYMGMNRVHCPTIMHKYAETPLHSLTSFVDLLRRSYDVALLCNAANSPFSFFARLRGIPLVTNVDGIERKRAKWNAFGKVWYLLGEKSAVQFSNRIVSDAGIISDYYKESYGLESSVIAYGAEPKPLGPGKVLEEFGLNEGEYLLYVSRLEPENNALGVVRAYNGLNTELPLVVVGDAPYAKEYIAQCKSEASEKVVFTGYQFGDAYRELRTNCYAYVQATEVGGTHPALVEAMAYGNCVIANDVPEHTEVLGDAGLYYAKNDFDELRAQLQRVLDDPELVALCREQASNRAKERYSWDRVVDQYEELFHTLKGGYCPSTACKDTVSRL